MPTTRHAGRRGHGARPYITSEFLADKPLFAAVADEFLAFVGDAPLVAHNAGFDIAFINAELTRVAKPPIAIERVVDTLTLARRKHQAEHNTLDDLCTHYGVNNSLRSKHGALLDGELLAAVYVVSDRVGCRPAASKHGALLDAELLATVYVELTTTRQAALQLEPVTLAPSNIHAIVGARPVPLPPRVTVDDRDAHREFVRGNDGIWLDYFAIRSAPCRLT
jgi:DNA polymerase III subunit epsilon